MDERLSSLERRVLVGDASYQELNTLRIRLGKWPLCPTCGAITSGPCRDDPVTEDMKRSWHCGNNRKTGFSCNAHFRVTPWGEA